MIRTYNARRLAALLATCALLPASGAAAHENVSGGASAPEPPEVTEVACMVDGSAWQCPQGQMLQMRGEYLRDARTVVFLGRKGRRDDRRVRPFSATPHRLVVRVPTAAQTGPVRVESRSAGAIMASSRVRVLAPSPASTSPPAPPVAAPATPASGGVFPIRGAHDYGTNVNRFGGGRDHKGQDVFAKCGTPVVAALAGEITIAKWHDAAGNYAVVTATDGTSQAYMHLQKPAEVRKGEVVAAGQQIGLVGDTGRASGCHLHFEFWTAPGWYQGGEPIDPLPHLKRWDRAA